MDENITPENQELIDRANIETKQKKIGMMLLKR